MYLQNATWTAKCDDHNKKIENKNFINLEPDFINIHICTEALFKDLTTLLMGAYNLNFYLQLRTVIAMQTGCSTDMFHANCLPYLCAIDLQRTECVNLINERKI